MSIISSIIFRQREVGGGRQVVREHHTDHLGKVHEHRYRCPVEHDTTQALLDWVPILSTALAESEKMAIYAAVENGADPALISHNYVTANDKIKQVTKALMIGSPDKLLKAAEYVQGFTDNQIENLFTVNQCIRIRIRQDYILDNQTAFNADVREEL